MMKYGKNEPCDVIVYDYIEKCCENELGITYYSSGWDCATEDRLKIELVSKQTVTLNAKEYYLIILLVKEFKPGESTSIDIGVKYEHYHNDKIIGNFAIVGPVDRIEDDGTIVDSGTWKVTQSDGKTKIYKNTTNFRTIDADFVKMKDYSVALEKYVSKVEGGGEVTTIRNCNYAVDVTDDGVFDKSDIEKLDEVLAGTDTLTEEQKIKLDVNSDGNVDENDYLECQTSRETKPIWRTLNHDCFDDKYKENKPVPVEPGDTVTYAIKLTNTGNKDDNAKNTNIRVTEIKEEFDERLEFVSISGYGCEGKEYTKTGSYIVTIDDNGYITIPNPTEIEPGAYEILNITFKVNVETDSTSSVQKFENTATVTKISNKYNVDIGKTEDGNHIMYDKDGDWNNTDSDWIRTKLYSVSLEKYVSNVTDGKGNEVSNIQNVVDAEGNTRNDHQLWKDTSSEPEDSWKYKNAVELEVGDIVTYTLKVTNTDSNKDNTNIWFTKITDEPHWDGDLQLSFYEEGSKTFSINEGSISSSLFNIAWDETCKLLTIEYTSETRGETGNGLKIEPGNSMYITLKFVVNVSTSITDKQQILENKAIVSGELKNRNNVTVLEDEKEAEKLYEKADKDSSYNNEDCDFVKTKLYSVSLGKYAYSVNDTGKIYDYDLSKYDYDNDEEIDQDDVSKYIQYLDSSYTLTDDEADINKDGKKDRQDLYMLITMKDNTRDYCYDPDEDITKSDTTKATTYYYNLKKNKKTLNKEICAVPVEPGDTVVYKLVLCNTDSNNDETNIIVQKITEEFNEYLEFVSIKGYGFGDSDLKETDLVEKISKDGNKWTITIPSPTEIVPGESKEIFITFKVNVPTDKTDESFKIENKATVSGLSLIHI